VILSSGSVLRVELPNSKQPAVNGNLGLNKRPTLEEAERKHILAVLEDAHWVLAGPNGAAARLGFKRSTLQYRINKLGLSRPESRAGVLA